MDLSPGPAASEPLAAARASSPERSPTSRAESDRSEYSPRRSWFVCTSVSKLPAPAHSSKPVWLLTGLPPAARVWRI
jgi:hypothetical protein